MTEYKKHLDVGEAHRLVKYVGLNGGLLIPSIHSVVQSGDFGWLILPGITTAITTPVVAKLFKKINKQDLLRILGTVAKANAVVAPAALCLILAGRGLAVDTSQLRDFSAAQVAELTLGLTAFVFLIDFWIESQSKLGEYKQTGDLTNDSNSSPLTQGLETFADKIIGSVSSFAVKIKETFGYKSK
ncbi:MAG: hypothetical protein LBO08_01840 [Rickettsiales bacterium]|nr:hypothetical protein [Rickettsiales bacterium]